jgi:restriction endonuclease S subunit
LNGDIPVVGGGQQPSYYHSKPNRSGPVVTVSSSGAYAGFVNIYYEDIFASDCFTIEPNNLLDIEYLFRVLKSNQERIYELTTGAAQPHIYPKDFENFRIPTTTSRNSKKIS